MPQPLPMRLVVRITTDPTALCSPAVLPVNYPGARLGAALSCCKQRRCPAWVLPAVVCLGVRGVLVFMCVGGAGGGAGGCVGVWVCGGVGVVWGWGVWVGGWVGGGGRVWVGGWGGGGGGGGRGTCCLPGRWVAPTVLPTPALFLYQRGNPLR